jgi:L-alanine-DL-glutamate epimerase-like enolase superfamily enzyme
MGPIDIASLHVSCAIRNCEHFELLLPEETFRLPMKDAYSIDHDSWIHIPEKPGLGIDLYRDAIQRTCADRQVLRVRGRHPTGVLFSGFNWPGCDAGGAG